MNLIRRVLKPSLYILISLVIAQCSSSDDAGLVGKVDTGECAHTPYDGGGPIVANKAFSVEHSGYFDKKIIIDHLESVLKASGESLANYVIQQGVQLYQIPEQKADEKAAAGIKQSACKYFAYLQTPSDEALKNWNDNAGYIETGETFLLGLFTTYYVPTGSKQYELREPTIMVRQDTQKWTLLHEFSHFLFADALVRGPMEDSRILKDNLRKAYDKLVEDRDTFDKDQTRPNARRLIRSMEDFFMASHELDQRGPLEEFSIESMLIDRLKASKISLVNDRFDLLNALGYMNSNKDLVVPRYEKLASVISGYNGTHFEDKWPVLSRRATDLENEINGVLGFINTKMEEGKELRNVNANPLLVNMSLQALGHQPEVDHHHFDMSEVELQEELYQAL